MEHLKMESFVLIIFTFLVTLTISFPSQKPISESNESDAANIPQTRGLLKKEGKSKKELLWPGGIVHYKITDRVGDKTRKAVLQAMHDIQNATDNVVKFIPYDKKNNPKGRVEIYEEKDAQSCVATIGIVKGGYLAVVAGSNRLDCGGDPKLNPIGIAVHELMHALGFIHEFQRNDRDNYIRIDFDAFAEKLRKEGFGSVTGQQVANAFQNLSDDTMGLPFDFKSIMQYDIADFTTEVKNAKPKPVGNKNNMGQICAISAGDRNLIVKTYFNESGKTGTPKNYTEDYQLPGYGKEGCRETMIPMNDEMEMKA